jgi:hypothetical protein
MKKFVLSLFVAMMATVAVKAQQIAVVSSEGTSIYRSLAAAIAAATNNSVIYLPGGGFPLSDEVKITNKKLTIIGIGHKIQGENADGYTTITGNLQFDEGSDGSAVYGCYITGNVIIGTGTAVVNDVTVRYCNANCVDVMNANCLETVVNQCYLRGLSEFHGANGHFTHNIAKSIYNIDNGFVEYNIFTSGDYVFGYGDTKSESTSITGNVFTGSCGINTKDCLTSNNMCMSTYTFGDDPIKLGSGIGANQIFEDPKGVTPFSNYHFKEEFREYEGLCGIYVGNGFDTDQLPPVPYIVAKRIPEQTDADGKLNIKVRVRAGN